MFRSACRTFHALLRVAAGLCAILLATGPQSALADTVTVKSKPALVIHRTAVSILELPYERAGRRDLASLRGVVTLCATTGIIVQDRTSGIWVDSDRPDQFSVGDVVEVNGTVEPGRFSPKVTAAVVRKVGHSSLPQPKEVTYRQLSSGTYDSQYVSIAGTVRSVRWYQGGLPGEQTVWLKIVMPDGTVDATLFADAADAANRLIDAVIRINAPALCGKNNDRQIAGVVLAAGYIRNLAILRPPPKDLFSAPLIAMGTLMQYRSGTDYFHRVRVVGTVTYYEPATRVIVQDGSHALEVLTSQTSDIRIGDRIEAVGFPMPEGSGPILGDAILRIKAHGSPLEPEVIAAGEIPTGEFRYRLVSTQVRLLRRVEEPSQVVLLLGSDSTLLTAEMSRPHDVSTLKNLQEGSTVRVSGISMLAVEGSWYYTNSILRSKLLLRSPDDIQVIRPPSWWTTLHVIYIAAILALLALAFLAMVIYNRMERWKLEAVLSERERMTYEIHDTLAQSFAGIGFQLQAIRKAIPAGMLYLQQQLDLARDLVRHSHREARRGIEALHVSPSSDFELLSALEICARKLVDGSSVTITSLSTGTPRPLPQRIAIPLLRIGQEAIANAVRHADPSRLDILLTYGIDSAQLVVKDDGNGFIMSGALLGFGLRGMRKRAAAVSAKLTILSQPGHGTHVEVTVALQPKATLVSFLTRMWTHSLERNSHVEN